MHILNVTLGFYPAQAWGGPVKIVHQNSKELVRRGHRVTIYCTNLLDKRHAICPNTFENWIDGMRVVYFRTWHLPWWPGTLGPLWMADLPAQLKKEIKNFDVIHINGYRNPMLLPVIQVARKAKVPIITQPHGTMPVVVNSFWMKKLYDRIFGKRELKDIKFLIALQESERQQALTHGIPREKIVVIPNGIDIEQKKNVPAFGSFKLRLGLDIHKPLILFLGRINKKKGTDMLINAFSYLKKKDAQLVVAGPDDGQKDEVIQLIKYYNLESRIWMPGLLTGAEVLSAFQDADIFVLPCRTDTFPVAIMESCLMDTPMVITEGCEIADLVKDKVACVTPFDSEKFASAIDDLLLDQKKYQVYKDNCSTLVKSVFSLETVVDQLEKVYMRALAES